MICSPDIPTLMKGVCYCGLSYPFLVARDFFVTQWNLGPYQEYRCSYCGNQALRNPETKQLMVLEWKRPAFRVDPERACK